MPLENENKMKQLKKRQRTLGVLSVVKRTLTGDLFFCSNYLSSSCSEDGAKLFSEKHI